MLTNILQTKNNVFNFQIVIVIINYFNYKLKYSIIINFEPSSEFKLACIMCVIYKGLEMIISS